MKKLIMTLLISLSFVSCFGKDVKSNNLDKRNLEEVYVTKVIDGDTFVYRKNGKNIKVRLVGINTPELHHPFKGEEYFGKEAKEFIKNKIYNKKVYLEKDEEDLDKYGRELRYVWISDDEMLNDELLREGFADVMTIKPNVKYEKNFRESLKKAKIERKGMWKYSNKAFTEIKK